MPEGDTIFRAAHTLHRALAGTVVTQFESLPALTRIADDHPIVGRTVESVRSRGKHMLMACSGGLTLRNDRTTAAKSDADVVDRCRDVLPLRWEVGAPTTPGYGVSFTYETLDIRALDGVAAPQCIS